MEREEGLQGLGKENEFESRKLWNEITIEVKKQLALAGPLMMFNPLIYFLQVISVMFVSHLGKLALSGASMASSFASVTGFSLMVSRVSKLNTLT